MTQLDEFEHDIAGAYERGELSPIADREEFARLKASARETGSKDKRINIRLSAGELSDIQTRALQEGLPYQTLISSVLHKYVTGRLVDSELMRNG